MRFFYPNSLDTQTTITIKDKDQLHHAGKVLRLKAGDKIEVINGQGVLAAANVETLTPKAISINIISVKKTQRQKPTIRLACAMPKRSKFEMIIEKATELGVDTIVPLITQQSDVKIPLAKIPSKQKRFETVALSAVKQCKRLTIPTISQPVKFDTLIKEKGTKIILSLQPDSKPIRTSLEKIKSSEEITLFIGPEGDFTPQEHALAKKHGCIAASLGPNTLRVETAAITALAIITSFLRD